MAVDSSIPRVTKTKASLPSQTFRLLAAQALLVGLLCHLSGLESVSCIFIVSNDRSQTESVQGYFCKTDLFAGVVATNPSKC